MQPPQLGSAHVLRQQLRLRIVSWAIFTLLGPFAAAQNAGVERTFDVPAQGAESALKVFSDQSGRGVIMNANTVQGIRTNRLKGAFTPVEALQRLLVGTGLIATPDTKSGAFVIHREDTSANGQRPPPPSPGDRSPDSQKKNEAPTPPNQEAMKQNKVLPSLAAMLALFVAPAAQAAEGTGSIEGRIQDITTGDYLNNARVTIEGTHLTTLTNQFGEYRVADVPAGAVQVKVFYSGLPAQTVTLTVAPGQRAVRDFELKSAAPADQTVQLQAFIVRAEQLSEVALATNEQRFAPNMKTVLSADSFGDQSEGNVAEFLKYMPSVSLDYVAQDARSVGVRGMPSNTTIVTSNGNEIASATPDASRAFEFEKLSINDIARIEFNKTMLPDMPAEGIGGTINLVTKGAFERSKPEFKYRAYVNFNTTRMELRKTPGPGRDNPTYKIKPSFDFTYINPVNKNFGFTISGASSSKYNPEYPANTTWNRNRNAATGEENPYLQSFNLAITPKVTDRYSGRIGIDWRFAPNDRLSIGFSEQYYRAEWLGRRWVVNTGTNPTSFSPAFTQGRPNAGSVQFGGNAGDKSGTTWTPEFKYIHNGPVWKFEGRGAYSHSSNRIRQVDKGHFQNINITLGSFNAAGAVVAPTVRFDNTGNYLPVVTAVLATGETVDAQDVDNFNVNFAVDGYYDSADMKKSFYFNARRVVEFGVPITVKAGGDVRQNIRDSRDLGPPRYTFVGADGRSGTRDNAVSALGMDIVDDYSTVAPPYGLPKFKWPSQYKLYDVYVAHPNWWTTNPGADLATLVTNSRYVKETIASGFVRLDASFFRNRLTIAGGGRFQDYRSYAESGEVDNLGQYVRDEEGDLVTDPATGLPIRVTGTPLENTARTNIERGNVTKGGNRGFYPSINAVYRLAENVQLRAAFANSVNYPQYSDVAGKTTVSDLTANPRRLTANAPLQPWTADNYDLDIEYYTPTGGSFTLAWFRKDISNFVNQARRLAGTAEAKAALEKYGYGALAPLNFEVVEKFNLGDASFDGWEFGFHQKLDTYVPAWARGVTVFYNTSYKAAPKGVSANNLNAESQRLMNWGASFNRGRVSAGLKWNHKPEPKRTVPDTVHRSSRTLLDIDLSYRVRPRISLFASAANATSVQFETYNYTESTPDYARRSQFRNHGVQCTVGVKGQF